MAEPVEVAIESALLVKLNALTFSPAIPVSLPNVPFPTPTAEPGVCWLRATFLPADSFALGIAHTSTNQHYGILQVDVFYSQGSGELAPGRIASAIMSWFERGTRMTKDGVNVDVVKQPYRRTMIKDDPWVMIPVFVPYLAFAS